MNMIETLTLNTAVAYLRAHGLKTSEIPLRDGLKYKIFPFGDYIPTEQSCVVLIYKEKLDARIVEVEE